MGRVRARLSMGDSNEDVPGVRLPSNNPRAFLHFVRQQASRLRADRSPVKIASRLPPRKGVKLQ